MGEHQAAVPHAARRNASQAHERHPPQPQHQHEWTGAKAQAEFPGRSCPCGGGCGQCGSRGEALGAEARLAQAGVSGQGEPLPHRERIQASFGRHDVSHVRAHLGGAAQAANRALGAKAYATENRVAFSQAPDLWLAAHEAAHVVQQRQGVVSRKSSGHRAGDAHERHADRVADQVARGESAEGTLSLLAPAGAGPAPAGSVVQRFAPEGHEAALTTGLSGEFGAEEIGQIEAANWERDFSQGSGLFADLVISWKQVKWSARHGGVGSDAFREAASRFQQSVSAVLGMGTWEAATGSSFGGYQEVEHLDRPDENPRARRSSTSRWKQGKQSDPAVPGWILDGKAYLKDCMVGAVRSYRKAIGEKWEVKYDNWAGGERPRGYREPQAQVGGQPKLSREVVEKEARELAQRANPSIRDRVLVGGTQAFAGAAQFLGRATHVLEDFFAHSNWLEKAKRLKARLSGKKPADPEPPLITGTFKMPDKIHSLGHKLLALARAIRADFDTLARAYGRTGASTTLEEPGHEKDKKKALSSLQNRSWTDFGEAWDVKSAVGDMNSLTGPKSKLRVPDLLTNLLWLDALQAKGEFMVQKGEHDSPPSGHGRIAKDQPEPGKDFEGADRLATRADQLVIAPLAEAMDLTQESEAKARLDEQLRSADQVVALPSESHPLMGWVE